MKPDAQDRYCLTIHQQAGISKEEAAALLDSGTLQSHASERRTDHHLCRHVANNNETRIMAISFLLAAIGCFVVWNPSASFGLRTEEGKAGHIRVINGSATMYAYKDYLSTQEQRAVGSEGIPAEIRIGDVVGVKDQRIKVKHIFWTRYLERAHYGKDVLAEVGDVQCFLVETPEDLPYSDEFRYRIWITIKQCEVLKELESH